jgi:signal transduction histidine kinase
VTSPLRILLLEDDPTDAALIQELLETDNIACELTRVQTRTEYLSGLEDSAIELILADYKLPSFDGLSALKLARNVRPDLAFIFVSGTLGEEVAIEAMKIGATDYVLKNRLSRLAPSVKRALREAGERKRAEQQHERLRQLEGELARINRVSTMGELAASLAHEIMQPIAGIATDATAVLRWLRREPPEIEEACQSASRIINGTGRAVHIVDRNRALYSRETTQRELIDLNEIIREMVILLHDTARRHSISIRTELDPALPATNADRVQLQQVLMNLMLNGIEAVTEESGELGVTSTRTENGELLIAVSDSGIGLPEAGPERIFEAFFTTKPDGTGMGLSISRRIIESHGGRLWASANAGRGATFQFTLPMEP